MDFLTAEEVEIVISAENNVYCAWQCLLAHYSCQKNLNITPLIVVHGEPHFALHRHFATLLKHGGRIQRVLNYRSVGTADYPPRNTPATLMNVKTSAPYIMLCDPDFLFLKPIPRSALPSSENEITFDYMSFMELSEDVREDLVQPARKAGVDLEQLENSEILGGAVPHIIPTNLARKLGADWLKCIEFFASLKDPILWIASMWSLVFSVQRLGLKYSITRLAITDAGHQKMIDLDLPNTPQILHYSYGDEYFSKRDYCQSDVSLTSSVWEVTAPTGSMSAFIGDYLQQVKKFYRIHYSLRERLQQYPLYLSLRSKVKNILMRFVTFSSNKQLNAQSNQLLGDLLKSDGDMLVLRDINIDNKLWGEVQAQFKEVGRPVGFIKEGVVTMNPQTSDVCNVDSVILLSQVKY